MSDTLAFGQGDEALAALVKATRPEPDAVALDYVRAQLEAKLFDTCAQPATLGDFILREQIGCGGMGMVYSADDPGLDRRVAIKVLRSEFLDTGARKALLEEARALAKLSDPNVVHVHQVVDEGGRISVVMEYVAGTTVFEWQHSKPRKWAEVLSVYLQIGRGLSAAHKAGIIHRDVKPQNAIIGDDGRVRVVDFGLARTARPNADSVGGTGTAELESLTTTKGVVGTPAYMSPEQLAGGEIGPASDQFGFCVSLYRALYDQRPFSGETLSELSESVRSGRLESPPTDRSVPNWVHSVVARGLSVNPGDRYASMAELVTALERDPWRRKRRLAGGGIAALVAGLLVWSLVRGQAEGVAPCSGGDDQLREVWNDARRAALSSALVAGGRYGASIREPLLEEIDTYGSTFATMHRRACMAHRRGEESGELLDRRMHCLRRRLDALAGAIGTLIKVDADGVKRARDVVANLPPIDFCGDSEAMAVTVLPPEDRDVRARVVELQRRLSSANAMEHLGRLSDALVRVEAIIAEAEQVGYAPMKAEALLAAGRIHLLERRFDKAATRLAAAEAIALEHGQLAIAVEATARRLYSEANHGEPLATIASQFELIEPISRRVRDGGFARTLLLNNVGVAHMASGDPEGARGFFERALEELDRQRSPRTELQAVVKNLAMVTTDPGLRESLVMQARRRVVEQLGEEHILALELGVGHAHYVADPAKAYRILKPTCETYARAHSDQPFNCLRCLYYQGFLETELGDRKAAVATFATAAGLGPAEWDWLYAVWRELAAGTRALLESAPRNAAVRFRTVLDRLPRGERPWWFDEIEAHARLGIGAALLEAGEAPVAAGHLVVAVERFGAVLSANQDVENRQRLALAQSLLGRARMAEGDRQGAAALFDKAEAWYREVSPAAYGQRLRVIERWRGGDR